MIRGGHHQRTRGWLARCVPLLRGLVFALILPIASSGALPFWAQLAGVEGPHVCHCSMDHHDCVCPRCDTDPDAAKFLSSESLKGRCGDDEHAFGSKALTVVLGASIAIATAQTQGVLPVDQSSEHTRLRGPPPTPPPQG